MTIPKWLADHLSAAATPRAATAGLLFHGTCEPFTGRLVASDWERLRWFAESPEVAQSYCPPAGTQALKSFPRHGQDDPFVPYDDFDEKLFEHMGFDVASMDIRRHPISMRPESYMIHDGHPSRRDAQTHLEGMGYVFQDESAWIKLECRPGGGYDIRPEEWRIPGRLFIYERPASLRLYDLQSTQEGGLTGRQWMETDLFASLADSGSWDGIIIDDIHHTSRGGHFGHRSIGLFQSTLDAIQSYTVACVHADPYDIGIGGEGSTTSEFDALHRSILIPARMAA